MQAAANEHVPVNPPAMINGEGRAAQLQMTQSITTQAQVIAAQANMEVIPQ